MSVYVQFLTQPNEPNRVQQKHKRKKNSEMAKIGFCRPLFCFSVFSLNAETECFAVSKYTDTQHFVHSDKVVKPLDMY